MTAPPSYFPVRPEIAFPRPGHALIGGRLVAALSRPARFRAARQGLALIRRGVAPELCMLGRIVMACADLEVAAITKHRPGDAGELVGERDG